MDPQRPRDNRAPVSLLAHRGPRYTLTDKGRAYLAEIERRKGAERSDSKVIVLSSRAR